MERPYEFVVVGGASLLLRNWVDRTTTDVDVLGRLDRGSVELASPLPPAVSEAAALVARSVRGLAESWFGDDRTAGLLDATLPAGFEGRLEPVEFPPGLRLHLAGRQDVITLKVLAATVLGAADRNSKHLRDLELLAPTPEELAVAREWVGEQFIPGDAQESDLAIILDRLGAP